jgi:hypothetical protein
MLKLYTLSWGKIRWFLPALFSVGSWRRGEGKKKDTGRDLISVPLLFLSLFLPLTLLAPLFSLLIHFLFLFPLSHPSFFTVQWEKANRVYVSLSGVARAVWERWCVTDGAIKSNG